MKTPLHILHLEDSESDAELIAAMLKAGNFDCQIVWAKRRSDFETALDKGPFDVILSDYSLPAFDGLTALQLAQTKWPEVPFVFVSGTIGEERAVEILKQGATDYVLKDRLTRLVAVIRRSMMEAEASRKRQRVEEQVREQAALLDRAQDAICLNDMHQCILYWNRSAERLYGWNAREALGRNANELLFHGDEKSPPAALKSLIRNGEWQGELHQVTKNEKKIIVESRWTLMRDRRGEPKSILVINTDITEKKQIEAQLLRTQRMESIGALAGGIAHDLNNALAPILMGIHIIRDELVTEESRQLLGIMQASARRSVDMVNQILSFARGVGGEREALDIRHLIKEMAKLAGDTFSRSIQIHSNIAPNLYPVQANPTQLHQVLLNLCVNARDAMPNGGRLSIEANNIILDEKNPALQGRTPGPYVLVTVTDTGHGMPPEVISRIFEPFFTTKEIGKGTGLGLSTVMGILKTHGGFVEVSSELGKGTLFRVYLPATGNIEAQSSERNLPEMIMGHGEQILLVDDEIAILEVTKLSLESFNYTVLTAKDGLEAVALYRQHQTTIQVVIVDMMMPVMNGPETVKALRKINPAAKIIAVSGLESESVLPKTGQPQVQRFLKKPFATEELLAALHDLLANGNA
jgi:two-component system cell cycle sensor histidine kinase/response regulator CckA